MIKLLVKIILITLTAVAVYLLIDTIGVARDLFRLYKKNSETYAVKRAVNKEPKDLTAKQKVFTPKTEVLPVQDLEIKYAQPKEASLSIKQREIAVPVQVGDVNMVPDNWQPRETVIKPPKQQKIDTWQAERIFESTSRLTRDIK